MPTDAGFLAAIAADPHDRLPRLVYADWLDERGDARGELIRLEEETRERVAWDETLWRLKPRRNELRGQTDADWLKAMGYGQTCEPLFRGQPFPTDVRDAWRLIREAHERWTGEPMPDVGGHADKIEETEKRLGLTLPASVREYIAFAHDLNRGNTREWMAVYRDPYTMRPVPGNTALSLILQSEGDVHWAVRFEEMHRPDPPVYTYLWGEDENGELSEEVFVPEQAEPSLSVSHFLFWYAHGYGSDAAGSMSVGVRDVKRVRAQLRETFPFARSDGNAEHYEATNISVTFSVPDRYDPGHLNVKLSRPLSRDHVPAFLLEMCGNGGAFSGVFAEELERRSPRPFHTSAPQEGTSLDDDIPF